MNTVIMNLTNPLIFSAASIANSIGIQVVQLKKLCTSNTSEHDSGCKGMPHITFHLTWKLRVDLYNYSSYDLMHIRSFLIFCSFMERIS